jgi:cytochrome c-type biogenesis protein CcsB
MRDTAARHETERFHAEHGSLLLLLVSLGVVFFLVNALFPVLKGAALITEQNILYVALIFYGAASALYLGFAVTGVERYIQAASLSTIAGLAANTLAVAHRWYVAGRPPLSNIYEMLLCFIWTLAALTVYVERRYRVRLIGTVTMPLAVLGVILMQLLPADVHPLVPALQSTWLQIHVTLAMLSYAACAVSAALALMFLIRDGMKTETFLAASSALVAGIYIGFATRLDASLGLQVAAWDPASQSEILLARHTPLMVTIPGLGGLFLLVLAAMMITLLLYAGASKTRNDSLMAWSNRVFVLGTLLQGVALAGFVLRAQGGTYASPQVEGAFPTRLAASPFIIAGLGSGLLIAFLYLLLLWRRGDLERLMPSAPVLDRLTYKTIGIAFPLLTLMIAAGAFWANRTWGSYWSWDPKETWALITWLVYAGYLHMRITRGWRGRRAAYFAILGFAVVLFTFFGVTYLLPGLHAYA